MTNYKNNSKVPNWAKPTKNTRAYSVFKLNIYQIFERFYNNKFYSSEYTIYTTNWKTFWKSIIWKTVASMVRKLLFLAIIMNALKKKQIVPGQ